MDEAKTRVVLNTQQAKAQLRSLVDDAKDAGQSIRKVYRSTIGKGLNAIGLGGAFGAGMQAIKGATEGSVGDIFGEALGPLGQVISHFFFGNMGEDARASKAAREDAINTFGAVAGAQHWQSIPPGVRNWEESMKRIHLQREMGKTLFESDPKMHGPNLEEVIKRIMEGIGTLVRDAMDYLLGGLRANSPKGH